MNIKRLVYISVMVAFICIASPVSVPVGVIPVSLATFAVYITASVLKTKDAVYAVSVYVLLGAVGVPVFSGFSGGFAKLVGITGGFILGYIPCAAVIGWLTNKYKNKRCIYAISYVAGTLVCYVFGMLWYMYCTNNTFKASLTVCVIPFLAGDIIKIIAASFVSYSLNMRIYNKAN